MTHQESAGLHHFHKRKKRGFNGHNHDNWWIVSLDKIIFLISVIGPLATIPQILEIWVNKNTEGIAMTSWIFFTVIALIWLVYGLTHKDKAITLNSVMWTIMDLAVVFGVLIY